MCLPIPPQRHFLLFYHPVVRSSRISCTASPFCSKHREIPYGNRQAWTERPRHFPQGGFCGALQPRIRSTGRAAAPAPFRKQIRRRTPKNAAIYRAKERGQRLRRVIGRTYFLSLSGNISHISFFDKFFTQYVVSSLRGYRLQRDYDGRFIILVLPQRAGDQICRKLLLAAAGISGDPIFRLLVVGAIAE